jgi:hypothetical protein
MRQQHDQAALVKRWRLRHAIAAERQRRLLAEEGPRPAQAVAESLSALNALEAMGLWPRAAAVHDRLPTRRELQFYPAIAGAWRAWPKWAPRCMVVACAQGGGPWNT